MVATKDKERKVLGRLLAELAQMPHIWIEGEIHQPCSTSLVNPLLYFVGINHDVLGLGSAKCLSHHLFVLL